MSHSNQQAPGTASMFESTIPAYNLGNFGGGYLPANYQTLSKSPSAGYIKRTISFLMHPPAQPTDPPVNFVVVNLEWARTIVGGKHFKFMEDEERYYSKGFSGKSRKGRPGLKERGLELGLPHVYWLALCGERKAGCKGEELILSNDEWEDGKEKREEHDIEWRRLA